MDLLIIWQEITFIFYELPDLKKREKFSICFHHFSFVSTLCTLKMGIGLISNQLERCLWWCSYAEFNQLKKEKIIRLQMNCKIA